MTLGGPNTNRIPTGKSASPLHLLRVMRYARPYLRYLIPGLICVVVVALTYSINILAVLPMIQLIADKQGIPAWVHQHVIEQRYGLSMVDADPDQPARVLKILKGAEVPENLNGADVIRQVDGREVDSHTVLREMVQVEDGRSITLGVSATASGPIRQITLRPKSIYFTNRVARRAASWLPQEQTKEARMRTLKIILAFVLSIGVTGATCRFFAEFLIATAAGRTVVAMRRRMYWRVLNLPLSSFERRGISDLTSRFVQDSQDIFRGMNFVFGKTLREPLKAIFAFGAALIIDWRITLVVVVSAPAAGLLIRQFGRIIRRAHRRLLEGYARMIAALEGALIGIRVVKGYTMEAYERRHLHAVDQQMLKQQLKIERTEALSSPLFETAGAFVAAGAILYFARLMFDDQMSFARFATLGACMAAIFDPVRKLSSFYNRIQQTNAAVDRVFEILDMPDELVTSPSRVPCPPLAEKIEFRDVRFTYPTAETPALDGINLTVRRGERVAFVGPNGSGKTTLLSLLMRFYDPQEGALLFDGRDVRAYSIASLRRQMSLITQDTVIFADTIGNNIAYGDERLLRRIVLQARHPDRKYPDVSAERDRLVAAAKAAYADEFIHEKPKGYDTYVGEHGVTLSGGQKQRVAIARAILRNAPIFIFDEATSQVDAESEQKIHDAVEAFLKGRTALIIAHRFSTIMQADRIVVMDRGRIVDVGRHDELMSRCSLYQTLCRTQILIEPSAEQVAELEAGAEPVAAAKRASQTEARVKA